MIRIVTDSNADLPKELIEQYHIYAAPAWMHLKNGRVRTDTLDPQEFQDQVVDTPDIPRTEPLSEDEYIDIFSTLLQDSEQIILISATSQISKVFEIAGRAAQRVAPDKITVYDSQGISLWAGFQAVRAAQMAAAGQTAGDIVDMLNQMRQRSLFFSVIDNLGYLHRGGRVNLAQYMLGVVFDLKPILTLDEGRVVPIGRGRGLGRVLVDIQTRLLDGMAGMLNVWLGVVHVGIPDTAQRFAQQMQDTLRPSYTLVTDAGPTIAAHTGTGSLGVVVCPAPLTSSSKAKAE